MHIVFEFGQNLLAANQHQADHNRQWFDQQSICCLNVMSSPGAGKTSLLEKALPLLTPFYRLAVLEGDMTTQLDADRLRQSGIPVIAITTGRACHLDARMIHGGLHQLEQESGSLDDFDLVIVENVGNLVCPAEFEVGEHAKVAVLSVTEGEDKPLKYPLMFQQADCLLINKVDLLPFLEIDRQKLENNVHEINPDVPIFWVSARTGEGIHQWLDWIHAKIMTEN